MGRGTGVSIIFINPYRFFTPWTPALITTELWLDAADSSTVTTVSGNVSQWDDKSSNGRNATQATAANRPVYQSGAQNGLNVIRFTAASLHFLTAGTTSTWNFMHNGTASSAFIVVKTAATGDNPNTQYQYLSTGGIPTTIGWGLYYDDRVSNSFNNALGCQIGKGTAPNAAVTVSNNQVTPGSYNIIGNYVDADNATLANRIKSRINGGSDFGSNTSNGVASTSNSTYALDIGQFPGGFRSLLGDVCEILILSSQPGTTDRQKIEGYLAHKWGLTANLPAGHPYENSAPAA